MPVRRDNFGASEKALVWISGGMSSGPGISANKTMIKIKKKHIKIINIY